jgi:hypothetical protein
LVKNKFSATAKTYNAGHAMQADSVRIAIIIWKFLMFLDSWPLDVDRLANFTFRFSVPILLQLQGRDLQAAAVPFPHWLGAHPQRQAGDFARQFCFCCTLFSHLLSTSDVRLLILSMTVSRPLWRFTLFTRASMASTSLSAP